MQPCVYNITHLWVFYPSCEPVSVWEWSWVLNALIPSLFDVFTLLCWPDKGPDRVFLTCLSSFPFTSASANTSSSRWCWQRTVLLSFFAPVVSFYSTLLPIIVGDEFVLSFPRHPHRLFTACLADALWYLSMLLLFPTSWARSGNLKLSPTSCLWSQRLSLDDLWRELISASCPNNLICCYYLVFYPKAFDPTWGLECRSIGKCEVLPSGSASAVRWNAPITADIVVTKDTSTCSLLSPVPHAVVDYWWLLPADQCAAGNCNDKGNLSEFAEIIGKNSEAL